ncbi:protein of unknown function [Rhodovastum atsumiense]|nr:protein of unknown function [Rhodovastum atsumiense]
MLAMLHWLGISPSYSRPRVSDDNAFAEAVFRTAKYRPAFPARGFADLEAARAWAAWFVQWYNHEHRDCRKFRVRDDMMGRKENPSWPDARSRVSRTRCSTNCWRELTRRRPLTRKACLTS